MRVAPFKSNLAQIKRDAFPFGTEVDKISLSALAISTYLSY
jgi:hypothetical protein